jgi:hypothetical protein
VEERRRGVGVVEAVEVVEVVEREGGAPHDEIGWDRRVYRGMHGMTCLAICDLMMLVLGLLLWRGVGSRRVQRMNHCIGGYFGCRL